MRGLAYAVKAVQEAATIAISCHVNPDGDTVGSMLALGLGLEKFGKTVTLISPEEIPPQYSTLPAAERAKRKLSKNVDLAITVDCNSGDMVGPVLEDLRKRAKLILAIDHHSLREPYENISLIDVSAAAVGEMVYTLLNKLKVHIDRDIARNILTSIIVETGSFRLPSVNARTFGICESLIRTGVDFNDLVETVFWKKNRQAAVLAGLCMSRCKFIADGRLAWTTVKSRDFKSTGGKDRDVDPVPDEIRAISGVDIVVFFREQNGGRLRVSLRSKKEINVGLLAREYGGGGHPDVAGCVIKNSPGEIKNFLSEAEKFLDL
ncbi:MAG: bifunctional oligoribonuclease/PAP phosphatase NrnA [Candidatus Omnitrophota bacterium]